MRAEALRVEQAPAPPAPAFPDRHGWLRVAAISLGAAVLTAAISLVVPKTYKADSRILPASGGAGSSLLALAAGTGLGDFLSGQVNTENPVLTYPEILHSTTILERTLLSPVATGSASRIIDHLGITERSPRETLDRGIRELRIITDVRANPRSGLITVSAVTRDSVLSAVIVQRMLQELDRFNVESRTSRGQATRVFVEKRMADSREELAQAEQALASFRQSNIRVGNSPQLRLQEERLEREVMGRSELYQLLVRQFEMARIEEKRDTPTFSVIDVARPPVQKYRPKVILNTLAAFAGAFLLQLGLSYIRALRSSRALHPASPFA